ncbi:MAG: diguanylate cyclase, partial [Rhodospirillales bacterium]|nr:diguanylate cyclase [Rhodospirillales bacterium]
HIHRSLDSAELLLRRVEEQLASKDIEALANSRAEWERLRSYVEELPQVSSIGIVDAGGELRLLTTRFPIFKSNYTFRDYFKAHAEGASRYIGPLVVAGTTGKLIFTVSRRLSTADGKFAGLIMASMDVEYFRAFYRSLDLGQGASVGVFRTDGRPLVRDPLTDTLIGMDLSAQPLFSRYIHERAQGTFLGRSPIDGKEKIITFRRSDDLGLVVTATASLEQVTQKFERRFLRSSAILAVVVLVVVSSSFIQIRAHRRETEAHGFTQSVLNSVATNIAILDKSGHIIEVNKPWRDFAANNGACTPDGFLGTSYFEICRAASGKEKMEAEVVANGIAAVMMDARQAFEHQYLCHSPTEERWFKMRVTPLVGRSGAVVVSHENITDLMRVTMIDGLTGLANQRFATETLAREFIRARRHDQKLSLVLLDCADPQQISETRGRAVTNRMLMAVARVMKEVGRDTDFPARLDRGRFLTILPHTTRDSALALSNRLEMLVSQVAMETSAGPLSIP